MLSLEVEDYLTCRNFAEAKKKQKTKEIKRLFEFKIVTLFSRLEGDSGSNLPTWFLLAIDVFYVYHVQCTESRELQLVRTLVNKKKKKKNQL
jgi:hypothetical protein